MKKHHTRYNGGIIRKINGGYQAEYSRGRQVRRKNLPTVAMAQAWIDFTAAKHQQLISPPTMAEILQLREAAAMLPSGVSVLMACAAYVRDNVYTDIAIQPAVDEFLRDKRAANRRRTTISNYRQKLSALGDGTVGQLDTATLQDWLDKNGYKGATREGYRRSWMAFFSWCKQRGYTARNPARGLARSYSQSGEVHMLTPAQAHAILDAAVVVREDMLPFLAVKMFCGLRTSEAMQLLWRDIGAGYITVSAQAAKTRHKRLVPVRPAIKPILDHYRRGEGLVAPVSYTHIRRWLRKIHECAGVEQASNQYRDSYISYRLAETGDAAKVASEAGNSVAVIMQSYRDLATRQAATQYFDAKYKASIIDALKVPKKPLSATKPPNRKPAKKT